MKPYFYLVRYDAAVSPGVVGEIEDIHQVHYNRVVRVGDRFNPNYTRQCRELTSVTPLYSKFGEDAWFPKGSTITEITQDGDYIIESNELYSTADEFFAANSELIL